MLDAAMQTQLKTYLANLREPIELVASLGDDAKSAQTRELLTEIAALSDKVSASFDGDDDLREVDMSRRQATYSYRDGEAFVFMDDEDYTPYTLDADAIGEAAGYIVDDLAGIHVQLIDETPVAVQLPQSVAIEVVETPPELKGGTATKRPKPARLSTGIEIQVPEYIASGEKVWVNTTTGEFGGRAD